MTAGPACRGSLLARCAAQRSTAKRDLDMLLRRGEVDAQACLKSGLHGNFTVSPDVISLVASSCGYYRGHIEHRAAHEFAVHVATQRGLVERIEHRRPPRSQPVAPMRERHCRRPRLTPKSCTA